MTTLSIINLDDYADPELYDLENERIQPAEPFYLTLAQEAGGVVLELGCGTGRYTIPLAEQGIDITGLDLVPGMLARAKAKAGNLPITWVQADARDFQLARKFHLIFESGAMFQHLLERADQEQMLCCVQEHLTDDGRFVVMIRVPTAALLTNVGSEEPWFNYTTPAGIVRYRKIMRLMGNFFKEMISNPRKNLPFPPWELRRLLKDVDVIAETI